MGRCPSLGKLKPQFELGRRSVSRRAGSESAMEKPAEKQFQQRKEQGDPKLYFWMDSAELFISVRGVAVPK